MNFRLVFFLALSLDYEWNSNDQEPLRIAETVPRVTMCKNHDIQVLEIGNALILPLYILNMYNEKERPSQVYTIPQSLVQMILPQCYIIIGDLNTHYPLWNSQVRSPIRADELIMLIEEYR
jgi:hypothetical protein